MSNPTFYELCAMAGAVYSDSESKPMADAAAARGWTAGPTPVTSGGFRAEKFTKGDNTVIAFRGTVLSNSDDLMADLQLGLGMNTSHFAAGEACLAKLQCTGRVTLCGHSLGGAIAQIVGNRARLPFVTFNAPGVAVFASRNIATANVSALKMRAIGAAVSALLNPGQAWSDVRSALYLAKGVNVCLIGDPVSQYGVHYGKVLRLMGIGHGVGSIWEKLKTSTTGLETLDSHFS